MSMKPLLLKPLAAALLLLPFAAQAAATPDAGSLLQQMKPQTAPVPSSSGTGLRIEQQGGAQLAPSAAFTVKRIRISGNTLFDSAMLHELVADGEGKKLDLRGLDQLAARITDYYRSHGYPLARAIIPAQTIKDGVLTMQVIEARYGKIRVDNQSRVNDLLLDDTLSPLQSGQVIGQQNMDHALLLLSDIPGTAINATLKPGATVGTSDLDVQASSKGALAANIFADNYGNRYTGKTRAGATVDFLNPLHHGDVLGASVMASGSGLDYGRISYESLLNGRGTRLGASYSAVHYVLGDTLAALRAHGNANVGSLWARQPFIRSRNLNLYGQLQYDQKKLRDRVDASGIRTDRHLDNWVLSLNGDLRDTLLSGGINTWSLGLTSGRVGYDDATAAAADAATAQTQGSYSKWNANFARHQAINADNELYLALAGQWSSKNLDSAEKMSVGGPYTVRAYDMGAASGDTGYVGNLELRHKLGEQWQGSLFADSAHVTVNRNPWATGANSATLNGAGIGVNWSGPAEWHASAYFATRLGSVPTLVANSSSSRAWVEVGKQF